MSAYRVHRAGGFRHTPIGHLETPTGVVIGCRYQPRRPQPSADAERIQRALLREPRPSDVKHALFDVLNHPLRWPVAFACGIAIGALLAFATLAGWL